MKPFRIVSTSLYAVLIAALAGCGGAGDSARQAATPAEPAPTGATASPAMPSGVPDLGSPDRWKKTADGKIIVTPTTSSARNPMSTWRRR